MDKLAPGSDNTVRFITPQWSAPSNIRAVSTTRTGGYSTGAFSSFNLGTHVGDNLKQVQANRQLLCDSLRLPASPVWLEQVHGSDVLYIDKTVSAKSAASALLPIDAPPVADAVWTDQPHMVLSIMTADCLPVLLASRSGEIVAAAHGGWRGLAAGILQKTVTALPVPARELTAWMGPAIGPGCFEVGHEVRETFVAQNPAFASAFAPSSTHADKCFADIFSIAEQCLMQAGVREIASDRLCTVCDSARFFSHRRDAGKSGRLATLIWFNP
jgi:YfiH family protein